VSLELLKAQLTARTPPGIVLEIGSGDALRELVPDETAASEEWAPQRRAQFLLGRMVARRALKKLGVISETAPASILFDRDGVPTWPAGAVASISHKFQNCVVVAAERSTTDAIGVDLELDVVERDEEEILARTCPSPEELSQVAGLRSSCCSPGTLFLAAKEAFFKLQFPITRSWLAWDDVRVTFGPSNTFAVHAHCLSVSARVRGVVQVAGGWLSALAFLPRPL
jgi:4'-phosphopantetheinyl transferase EntD